MLRVLENFTCGLLKAVMGRRAYHVLASNFYRIRSTWGVKALGVLLITIFCIFMYGPNLKPRERKVQGFGLLTVQFEILANPANMDKSLCSKFKVRTCSSLKLHLRYVGKSSFRPQNWRLYFSVIRRVVGIQTEAFRFSRVNGDLYYIEPTESFEEFSPFKDYEIPLIYEMYMLSYSDIMPNFYVVEDTGKITVIENTHDTNNFAFGLEGENLKRMSDDHSVIMNPEARYFRNEKSSIRQLEREAFENTLIPTPKSVKNVEGRADLSKGVIITGEGWESFSTIRQMSITSRFATLGIKIYEKREVSDAYMIKISKPLIRWKIGDIDPYDLKIEEKKAVLTGSKSGIYYGLQTFLGLLSPDMNTIPCLDISDTARFKHRGFMLDVARHFKPKSAILRLLDQMAAYKLNIFHFHLSDDEGWRLDIPGLPELVEYGSRRCHNIHKCLIPQLGSGPYTDNLGTGYYTIEDFKDILKYASARNIKVLPEFDMPGHARAAVMSMEHRFYKYPNDVKKAEQYRLLDPNDESDVLSVQFFDRTSAMNPCLGSTYRFIHKLIAEVQKMYQEVGLVLDYFNIGGDETKSVIDIDEPWQKSPVCQNKGIKPPNILNFFLHSVNKIFEELNIKKLYAWSDVVGQNPTNGIEPFKGSRVGLYLNFWNVMEWGAVNRFQVLASNGLSLINNMPEFLYFDMPQEAAPYEKGLYWATRYLDLKKVFSFSPVCIPQNVEYSVDRLGSGIRDQFLDDWPGSEDNPFHWHGIQANLWSETIRTEDDLFFMVFPRLLALAERAWHKGSWELEPKECTHKTFTMVYEQKKSFTKLKELHKEYELFMNLVVQREYPKLDAAGVGYRVPVPGYILKNKLLEANVEFPGFLLQVSFDGGKNWVFYDKKDKPEISDASQIRVRTITQSGKQFSRSSNERLNTLVKE